ncbi:MAG TPA: aldehyde ferredoxin oxidoreductase, partial [Thermoprotei archaeon]|nr:aldehyde ferredoxin oxidoreductase [Thermoprotei archaeon]
MYGGWMGKILRINLSSRKYREEKLSEELIRNYIGGRGFAVKILWSELKPKINPLSPENKVILATGPLSGTFSPSSGKLVVATKSPLTKGYGDGNIGGHISSSIKMCGYDAIIIEGKSNKPVYLYITPNSVEFKNADHIWGKGAIETDHILRKDHGNSIGTLVIGPGGENLVKYAVVITEYGRAGGRPGIGCVFGSKKLKAIVTEGWLDIPVVNLEKLINITRKAVDFLKKQSNYDKWVSQGTMAAIEWSQENAVLPTYNFQENVFEKYREIGGETMSKLYKIIRKACFSCPMPCGNIVRDKKYKIWSELDYENVAMFGPNLGIDNMDEISRLNYMADEYGIDAISLGNVIGFVIEAFKKGYIDETMTNGLKLKFGDPDIVFELMKMVTYRKGIGDLMAEGTRTMAEKLGGDTYKFAMNVKGLEITAYDSHSAPGMALAYGTSPIGAHHKDAWFIAWELKIGRDVVSREKVEKLVLMQRIRGGLFEILTVCR